jgi:hypothetical protein
MLNLLADAEDDHQTSSLIHDTSVVDEFLTLQGMVWRYLCRLTPQPVLPAWLVYAAIRISHPSLPEVPDYRNI